MSAADQERPRGRPRRLRVGSRVVLPSGLTARVTALDEDEGGPFMTLLRDDGEELDLRHYLARWPDGVPL